MQAEYVTGHSRPFFFGQDDGWHQAVFFNGHGRHDGFICTRTLKPRHNARMGCLLGFVDHHVAPDNHLHRGCYRLLCLHVGWWIHLMTRGTDTGKDFFSVREGLRGGA